MYHLLDIRFLAEIQKAFLNNLPTDVLFGTGLLILDDHWKKAMVCYLANLQMQLGTSAKDQKEPWEGH
jgi:hypothetical protein